MPIPTTYSEETLAIFLDTALGAVADVLGWTVEIGSYDEIVNETLLAYGQTDLTQVTGTANLRKLRALGRRELWRAVVEQTSAKYDIKEDNASLSRSQIHKMALESLGKAEAEAAEYDDRYRVGIDRLEYKHDPYQYRPEDERTL